MTSRNIKLLLAAGVVALAWVQWADHPTARNLRTAIADTLIWW